MKRLMLSLLLMLGFGYAALARTGGISGTIYDETKNPVEGAIVQLLNNGTAIVTNTSGEDGTYTFPNLSPGKYDLKVTYSSYRDVLIKGVKVSTAKTTYQNVVLQRNTKNLGEVVVRDYKAPLIKKDEPGTGQTITSEQIEKLSSRNTNDMATLSGATYQKGRGRDAKSKSISIAGARTSGRVQAISPAPPHGAYESGGRPTYYTPSNESYAKVRENDFMNVKANPLSTLSVDVDRASYSNVRRYLNEGQKPPADAVRVEEMINYFDYNYPQPKGEDPIAIVTELTDCPWNEDHQLLRVGMQARKIETRNLPASNIVFLIDVSGSMSEANKLPLVKSSLKLLVRQLRAKDKVSIVVYAGSAGLVLPPTSGADKSTIIDALERLQSGGSTAGGAGIKLAYRTAQDNFVEGGNNRIIIATDGDFNVGVSGENELEDLITKERKKGIFLTCLGYGMGNYKDSKMEILADKGNGNYAYIDNIREAEKILVHEFGGTLFTVAKDVKAQIEFNPNKVQGYRLVGYENRLLNEEDFKDDKKDAGEMGSGHQVTMLYEIIPVGVKSKKVRGVTDLKYQQREATERSYSSELATIKFRYKQPEGSRSKEMVHTISDRSRAMEMCSEDTRFASSVALFGMLLRSSKFVDEGDYSLVLQLAKGSKGEDEEGYRTEFVQLVKSAGDKLARY